MTQKLQEASSDSGQHDEDGLASLQMAGHFQSQSVRTEWILADE